MRDRPRAFSEVTLSSSGGARWKLARGSAAGTRDIVTQLEGPVPPGPALVETRFYFQAGEWHFTERSFPGYGPWVAKEPRPWYGGLGFHGSVCDNAHMGASRGYEVVGYATYPSGRAGCSMPAYYVPCGLCQNRTNCTNCSTNCSTESTS